MTPVTRCLHKLDHASAVTALVMPVLDELEGALSRPAECIVALEEALKGLHVLMGENGRSFTRFLFTVIDQRHNSLGRHART